MKQRILLLILGLIAVTALAITILVLRLGPQRWFCPWCQTTHTTPVNQCPASFSP